MIISHKYYNLFIRKFFLIIILLIYRLALDYVYHVAYEKFFYLGFILDMNALKIFESYFWSILLASLIPSEIKKPSDFFIGLLLIVPVFPCLSLYGNTNADRTYTYFVILCFIIIAFFRKLPIIKIKWFKSGKILAYSAGLFLILLIVFQLIMKGRFGMLNFNFSKVYEFREEIKSSLFQGIWGYIFPWTIKIANPFLIVFSLARGKRLYAFIFILFQILLFASTSHKSAFFLLFMILGIYYFFKYISLRYINHLLALSFTIIVAVSYSAYIFFEYLFLYSLFVRRLLFVPAFLNYKYHEFFSQNGLVYFSNKLLSGFIDYPYDMGMAALIGQYINLNVHANTGFLGTSYMHAGYPGMILYAVIVGFLLRLIDHLIAGRIPFSAGIATVSVPLFSLFVSSDLPTNLITHGLALALIFLWFVGSRGYLTDNNDIQGAVIKKSYGALND